MRNIFSARHGIAPLDVGLHGRTELQATIRARAPAIQGNAARRMEAIATRRRFLEGQLVGDLWRPGFERPRRAGEHFESERFQAEAQYRSAKTQVRVARSAYSRPYGRALRSPSRAGGIRGKLQARGKRPGQDSVQPALRCFLGTRSVGKPPPRRHRQRCDCAILRSRSGKC